MSGAVCPACGVAVMPGYARCPKCRKPLPRRLPTAVQGGTAVEDRRRWPLFAIIGTAVLGVGLIVYIGRGGGDAPKPAPAVAPTPEAVTTPNPVDTTQPFQDQPTTQQQPAAPDPAAAAANLERDLKRQRLWSNVTVSGNRVEVRSGSCSDPAMGPALDGASGALKAAGVTKLRCVEQSGRVVTDRDL